MRKIFAIFSFLSLLMVACNEPEGVTTEKTLRITSDTTMNFEATGGEGVITFTIAEGEVVDATSAEEWIVNITPAQGSFTFSVEANSATDSRRGAIELRSGEQSATVNILQAGAGGGSDDTSSDVKVTVTSPRELDFKAEGGAGEISYTLEGGEEGELPAVTTTADWIVDLKAEADKATFTVKRNSSSSERKGRITLGAEANRTVVTIVQAGTTAELRLSAENTYVYVGEPFEFKVVYSGEDVTAEAEIYDYATNSVVSNPYTFTEVCEKVFYATYEGIRSKVLTINSMPVGTPQFPEDSNPESFDFHHRLLLIDHTGTGCPNCPMVMSGLKALAEDAAYNDKYNVIMVHSYNSNDPAFSLAAKAITEVFENEKYFKYERQVTGYPSVTANFWYGYIAGANNFNNTVRSNIDGLWKQSVDASIAGAAAVVGNEVVVSVSVKSAEARRYHVAAWLMEDGIYAPQSGAREEWQNTHNNAFRECAGTIEGDDLSGIDFGYVKQGATFNKVLNIPIKESWNKDKMRVMLILSTPNADEQFEVVTTAVTTVGGSVGFEYN